MGMFGRFVRAVAALLTSMLVLTEEATEEAARPFASYTSVKAITLRIPGFFDPAFFDIDAVNSDIVARGLEDGALAVSVDIAFTRADSMGRRTRRSHGPAHEYFIVVTVTATYADKFSAESGESASQSARAYLHPQALAQGGDTTVTLEPLANASEGAGASAAPSIFVLGRRVGSLCSPHG